MAREQWSSKLIDRGILLEAGGKNDDVVIEVAAIGVGTRRDLDARVGGDDITVAVAIMVVLVGVNVDVVILRGIMNGDE